MIDIIERRKKKEKVVISEGAINRPESIDPVVLLLEADQE